MVPGPLCCVLGQDTYSHNASLHPGVQMGTDKINAGGYPAADYNPIQGE